MSWSSWDEEYRYKLEQKLKLREYEEFLKHEKKYVKDLENRSLFERIFNIKPKRKKWIYVKTPHRFDDSKYLNKEKVNNIKGDGKMKITSWEQFKGLKNGKGLCTEAYLCSDKIYCEFYISDTKHKFMLGIYSIDNFGMGKLITTLKKYGFDIEYEKSFDLVQYLKESIEIKNFQYNKINFHFVIEELGNITIINEEDYQNLNCMYFDKKIGDVSDIEAVFYKNKVTKEQLLDALKELGWI